MDLAGYLYIRDKGDVPNFLCKLYEFLNHEVIDAFTHYDECLIIRDRDAQEICVEALRDYYDESRRYQ